MTSAATAGGPDVGMVNLYSSPIWLQITHKPAKFAERALGKFY
jgi:hypothetical protein